MKHFDLSYVSGNRQKLALITALLECEGKLIDSFKLTNYRRPTFHIRVALPEGQVARFNELIAEHTLDISEPMKPRLGNDTETD